MKKTVFSRVTAFYRNPARFQHSKLPLLRVKFDTATAKSWISRFNERLEQIRKLSLNIVVLVLGFIFVLYAVKKIFFQRVVLIEPFDVSESLGKSGVTGALLAEDLDNQLDSIKKDAARTNYGLKSQFGGYPYIQPVEVLNKESDFKVEIEGSGISMAAAIQAVRDFLGIKSTRVNGQVYNIGTQWFLSTRITGNPSVTVPFSMNNLEQEIYHSALYVEQYAEPQILLQSFANTERRLDYDRIAALVSYLNRIEKDKKEIAKNDLLWGYLLDRLGDYQRSHFEYQQSIEYDPANPYAYLMDAENRRKNFLVEQSFPYYKKALELKTDEFTLCGYGLGLLARKTRADTLEAIANFKKAIQYKPTCVQAYKYLGDAHLIRDNSHRSEDATALAYYRKALDIDPWYADASFAIGTILLKQEDTISASRLLKDIYDEKNSPSLVAFKWGYIYLSLNKINYKKAAEYYDHAISLDTNNIPAYYNLALCLEHINKKPLPDDFERAVSYFKKTEKYYPWFNDNYNTWGNTLMLYGDTTGAARLFEKAYTIDKYNLTTYLNLVDTYGYLDLKKKSDTGRMNRARLVYRAGVKQFPGNERLNKKIGEKWLGVNERYPLETNMDSSIYYLNLAYRKMQGDTNLIKELKKAYLAKDSYLRKKAISR